jgi:hypothetical protein
MPLFEGCLGKVTCLAGNVILRCLSKSTSKNRIWFVIGIATGSEDIEVCCCLYIRYMDVNFHTIHHSRLFGIRLYFHLQAPTGRFFGKSLCYSLHQFFPIVSISVAVSGRKTNKKISSKAAKCLKATCRTVLNMRVMHFGSYE